MFVHASYKRTCILNYTSKTSIFDNEIYNHNFYLLFYKVSVYLFSVAQILKPYRGEFKFVLCVCREGAICMLLIFVMLFISNSELYTKLFSCQTNRIWKNIFIDNIYNANIFQVAY